MDERELQFIKEELCDLAAEWAGLRKKEGGMWWTWSDADEVPTMEFFVNMWEKQLKEFYDHDAHKGYSARKVQYATDMVFRNIWHICFDNALGLEISENTKWNYEGDTYQFVFAKVGQFLEREDYSKLLKYKARSTQMTILVQAAQLLNGYL